MPDFTLPTTETLHIDRIRPYWRNPREIPESAIAAVKDSIERYGYQQPIVVDAEHVIITGHTRYAALRALGAENVPVLVAADLTPQQVKEYRVLDNRVSEFSSWDEDALALELREFEQKLLEDYFPDIDLGLEVADIEDRMSPEALAQEMDAAVNEGEAANHGTRQVTCPACFHEFEIARHPADASIQ